LAESLDKAGASWWNSPIRALALSALLLLAACESTSGGAALACESNPGDAGHVCTIYSGPGLAMTCEVGTSPPSNNCPTAKVLGTCSYALSAGGIGESVSTIYYSDGNVTAATAEMECATFMGSSWSAN
jgi:hypothetical protein